MPQHEYEVMIPHLTNLLYFLAWYRKNSPGAMWGGITIEEACDAACKMSGVTKKQFDSLVE